MKEKPNKVGISDFYRDHIHGGSISEKRTREQEDNNYHKVMFIVFLTRVFVTVS